MPTDLPDPFDRASRYLLRRNEAGLVPWLLSLKRPQADFVQWLDTRRIPWPGQPERTCDTVAHVLDTARHGVPWAVVIEFQLKPDAEMFGRLLIYLGQLWLDLRPTPHAGDRFCVAAVVVNLTGRGNSSRDYHWPEAGLRSHLMAKELDLAFLNADQVLAGIEAGTAPRAVLAWTPLMKGGDDSAIIQRWLALASQEQDPQRRADLGLAALFAEAAGRQQLWRDSLKGWNMIESEVVKEWQTQARIAGEVQTLLRVLSRKFGAVPPEVTQRIEGTTDPDQLVGWIVTASMTGSLDDFRREAGL